MKFGKLQYLISIQFTFVKEHALLPYSLHRLYESLSEQTQQKYKNKMPMRC